MDRSQIAQLSVEQASSEEVKIKLSGSLDIHAAAKLWPECLTLQNKHKPQRLVVEASELIYCDSAGLALFLELESRQNKEEKSFLLENLKSDFQKLMDALVKSQKPPEMLQEEETHKRPQHLALSLGHFSVGVWDNLMDNLKFIGAITCCLPQVFVRSHIMRWKDFWEMIQEVGPNALPIIALLGFLIGLISAFQSAIPLQKFGAQIYIGSLVGISLVKELGPLMTAIIIAGRTASLFAASIGTMKVNQEVDALTAMGLDSVKFLTIPRILATACMAPFLNIFLIFFGLVGCGIVMHTLGFSMDIYVKQLETFIALKHWIGSLIKSFVFGIVIAGIGCVHGLRTRFGASAVGNSTTQAVVSGIIMIVVIDGIFAAIFYALGI